MEAINETAKLIKELGPKKAAGYFLLASMFVLGCIELPHLHTTGFAQGILLFQLSCLFSPYLSR